MHRRDFLELTAAGCAALCGGKLAQAAPAPPALTVRQEASDRFTLAFKPARPRPLRILQITDTHFGTPTEQNRWRDLQTYRTISALLVEQQPDFIVHTGDFINNDQGPHVVWDALTFMDSLGIPWTHTLGNHDIGAVSVEDYRLRMRRSAFGYSDRDGRRDYCFRLDVTTDDKQRPAWTLFCFDSGFQVKSKHVSGGQLEWFGEQLEADRSQGAAAPALALIHIPVAEFHGMYADRKFSGIFGENVSFESDTGQTFAAFRQSQRIRAVFSGHDHANDFHGRWEGIELAYGRVTGWSGYGDLVRGGRLIELDPTSGSYTHRLVLPRTA